MGSLAARGRLFHGLGRSGFVIVAVVALILALSRTVKWLVTRPFPQWFESFVYDWAYCAFVGLAILLAAVWARHRVPTRGWPQYATAAVAVVLATAAALIAIVAWESGGTFGLDDPKLDPAELALGLGTDLLRFSTVGFAITSAWLYVCSQAEHQAAAEQCAIDAERMDRQVAEARLQVLEAQIEPHFLFNTLAHVKRLYETDPAAGARMLRNLADYLAGSLPQMRAASTLGREIDHVVAYLDIPQIRMGRRLAYDIDVPAALRDAELPPLMVLTLVENAIKHGLSPLREGGRIDVRASVAHGHLTVRVADTGQGFARSAGGGTGLANTRARLASRYGAHASLSLALNPPRGVVATVELPYLASVSVGSEA
jgi:hypothetical protein